MNNFQIFYTNANSLPNKISELSIVAKKPSIGALCITETDLNSEICDAEISVPNFNVFREDREGGKKGGGSAIFVRKEFVAEKLNWFSGTDSIAVKVKMPNFELYIVCLYRSPSLRTLEQNEKILSQIGNIPTELSKNVVVMGDVNLPNIDWKRGIVDFPPGSIDTRFILQSEFLDLFIAKGLSWFINEQKTRVRKVGNIIQKSTLDQVFANNEALINNVEFQAPLGKSDHIGIIVELKLYVDTDYVSSQCQNWYKVDTNFVLGHASEIDWNYSSESLNVEGMWDEIYQKMVSISDQVPLTTLKTNASGEILEKLPWDSSKLVRKRKEKDQAWKAFDDRPYMSTFQTALYKQKEYTQIEIEAKLKYENKIIKSLKTNTKRFFRYLKTNSKLRKTVTELTDSSGNRTKSPLETADTLLNFFQSVFQSETYGPLTQECFQASKTLTSAMSKLVISPDKVGKLLANLKENKSMGPDKLHPKLLKLLAGNSSFVSALTLLLNKCIDQETIPAVWKSAVVVPIHKKGSVHLAENYRPVSLTCILCKLYETILREHILPYVIDIITEKQHGFCPGKSCLSNLLETLDVANEYIAEGNSLDLFYFDFSKAFDTVSHYRLLVKLENMGFSNNMLNIIKDFLGDRVMKVKVGDAVSKAVPVTSGVPQGSVLGPLLFLLFINDLPANIKNEIRIFADDVKMVVDPSRNQDVQHDLDVLCHWENNWLLRFNLEKCKLLHVGKNNPRYQYKFLGSTLCTCTTEKDLGVTFNEKFDFSDHIYASISKAKSSLAWLLRNVISRNAYEMKTAYRSLVRHNLEYCCQVWAPKARHGNWKTILDIEAVQRTFTRVIEGMADLNYKQRLEKLNMTTLLERRMRGDLIETFKILNGFNNYGSTFFKQSDRTKHLIYRPSKAKNTDFFSDRVLQYWNKLPEHVKEKNSVNSFKNGLDKFRENGIKNHLNGQFWELSDEVYKRIYCP